jgi:hypothetical protein
MGEAHTTRTEVLFLTENTRNLKSPPCGKVLSIKFKYKLGSPEMKIFQTWFTRIQIVTEL